MKYEEQLEKSEQSGRSMVEMLGVLAIIGVLSIGGISGYSKAMAKYRVNQTLDQISMLVMNIRTLYSNNIDYSGLSDTVAINMGIVPNNMLTTGSDGIINAYQGEIKLGTASNNRQFTVTYSGLPREACVTIATADWGLQAGSGLQSIGIGTSAEGKKAAASFTTQTIDNPWVISTAATSCNNTTDNGNSIQWTFY